MQHTLIPLRDRRRLYHEYYVRAIAVFIFTLAVSVVIGAAALFPAYIQAWFFNHSAQNEVSLAKSNKTDESLEKIKAELSSDNALLTVLTSEQKNVKFSPIIKSVIGVRGSVRITSFVINMTTATTTMITLTGIAPTRADLIAFRGRLEVLIPGNKINIPIDQLAKNINTPFTLKFSKPTP
ncbi:MAG: hypothetical protein NT077_04290 [Candidatus Taylorbacteria bacterium]|nr:hypothetical protein [Candidatus Taylorbacteria bacterium]